MLTVQNISFSYSDYPIIQSLSFVIEKGKNVAIIGESGCGKSTLLQLIYGQHDLNEGLIYWNNLKILGPKEQLIPGMPFMKYLSQDFGLMPFISVSENIGKYLSNFFPEQKKERINALLNTVEMTPFANTKVKNLSGGQMQRVALASVLAMPPEILLLDEPFSHIDNFRKNSLRRNLFQFLKSENITTIIATHDSTDVLSFTDEVLVLQEGKMISLDTPKNTYNAPKNKYVASLFGDVNELKIAGEIRYVYPHQIKLVDFSSTKVEVVSAYYRGSCYLIEAKYETAKLFFEHDYPLVAGEFVYINLI
jgi:ABC-type sulfate/molybdate transport systems ATPase subunit